MTLLQAHAIYKAFRSPQTTPILSDLSLTVEEGESIAIMGRSGVGKTTLLHILGTLEDIDQGTLTIKGRPVTPSIAPWLRNQHIGFIFQSFHLLEDFSAIENVLMPLRIARKPIDLELGRHLLDQVGLADRAHFPAKLLSGGEKQRVAMARALCNNPDLILADEPSGNLDQANAEAMSALLFSLVQKEHKTLILVTHDPDLAALCKRRYLLSGGQLS